MFEINLPRKLEVIPVRDVRRFLVESCGLTKSDVDNAECGNEDLQQVFLWALGLEQAPRSNHYGNYGPPFAIDYLLFTPYMLLPTTGAPAPPTTGLQMCASPLRPPRRICKRKYVA